MDRLWKYLSVLILLQLAMMTYIFLRVPNTSKIHSDSATLLISKKNLNILDGQGTFNIITDVMMSNKSGKHLPSTHERFSLPNNSFYSNGKVQLKARNKKLINLKKLKKKRNFNGKNPNNPLESKEPEATQTKSTKLVTTDALLNYSNNTKKCVFTFDKKSLSKARKTISTSQSVYLFYINLNSNEHTPFVGNPQNDTLIHWQYVLKKEKYLVQLPVDFDLFTFRLLSADSEEMVLDVELLYTDSNCNKSDNLIEETYFVRALLWNELFQNDTRFYLCNRNIQDKICWRDVQYYITTIWVGYDLNCSEVNDNYGIQEVQLTKDDLPLVAPIFCYLLSLQFVWIFVLLDVYKLTREDELTNYTENDRPYSTKRFIQKILYKECYCICYCWCDICKICKCLCCKCPITRLLFLTWLFILLPVGLYRTLGRFYILDKEIYHDYVTVVKPSESILNIKKSWNEHSILAIDSIYATCAPLIFVFISGILYRTFVNDEKEEDGEEGKRDKHNGISEKFSKPSEIFFQHLMSLISCNCFNCSGEIDLDKNKYTNKTCCYMYIKDCDIVNGNEKKVCSCSRNSVFNCRKYFAFLLFYYIPYPLYILCYTILFLLSPLYCIIQHLLNFIYCTVSFLWYLLGCLFPIIPFSYKPVCADSLHKYGKCTRWCCRLILAIFQFFFLYAICLRPIISTFTFILRAFTYFVFVALLIRTHILQFTLIFVTTFVYFSKYLSEMINMNVDILKYIISLQKKLEQNNKHNNEQTDKETNKQSAHRVDIQNINQKSNEQVDEKKFTYIYEKLAFVRKKIYILCLKTLVIFMYMFITIETFIRNKNSLNATSVKSIVEFLLLIIGPYAISFFIKTNKGDFLSDENKQEIEQKLNEFERKELQNQNKDNSSPDSQGTKTTNNEQIVNSV